MYNIYIYLFFIIVIHIYIAYIHILYTFQYNGFFPPILLFKASLDYLNSGGYTLSPLVP